MENSSIVIWAYKDLSLIAAWSFIVCAIAVCLLSPLARAIKLLDKPDNRKLHAGSIPLVGGLAVAVAVFAVIGSFDGMAYPGTSIFITIGIILVALGALDDYIEIRPKYRLAVQIAIGIALCFVAELKVVNVGNLYGNGHLLLGYALSIGFTIMCSVGVFNSINMIDGIDGLAGVIAIISASTLAFVSAQAGDTYSTGILIALVAALLPFMLFNLSVFGKKNKVFLGDAGSLFLGFVLLWFFITLSQGDNASLSPVVAGWIFGVPLVDTVSVIVGRMIRGEAPLRAGRDHIHHRLLSHGFELRTVLIIISFYHLSFNAVGVLFNNNLAAEPYLFWSFVLITICHFFLLNVVLPKFQQKLNTVNIGQ